MHFKNDAETELKSALVTRLRHLMAPAGTNGRFFHGNQLFSYCSIDRERLKSVELPSPILGIMLRGQKEVWLGDVAYTFEPGTVFILPSKVPMDVVNVPASLSSPYESLLLEVASLPRGIAPDGAAPFETGADAGRRFQAPLSMDLVDALVHAATAIADSDTGERVKALRLSEVLTILRPCTAARPLFETSLAERVAWLVRSDPAGEWSVARIAASMALGASTLRRRLANEGCSFRHILRQERLQAGRDALLSGAPSCAAAEAAGYTSRSHFARRYRESFGTSPKRGSAG
ncbi:AraC family transcriptional regulator [Mesorhizobium sp. B2-3-4]|nr:AraC family transcriptional regulator [Mesorhizobium sp. B2-3-4]